MYHEMRETSSSVLTRVTPCSSMVIAVIDRRGSGWDVGLAAVIFILL